MVEAVQVFTTTGSEQAAQRLAERLIHERLAACVQVSGPIESTYRWQGAVERAREWLCLIKTTRQRYADVERAIRQWHDYDEPEILAVPVVAGSPGYLQWLEAQLSVDPPRD